MHCVNPLAKSPASAFWEKHQVKAISKVVVPTGSRSSAMDLPRVEPLFPGSYLCNHLVVLEHGAAVSVVDEVSCEASLDTIYESMSHSPATLFESYILIDAEHLDEVTMPLLLDAVYQNMEGANALLVLNSSNLPRIKRLFIDLPLKVESVDPEWRNAASIIALYRNANYCVFVDSFRVMDAAVSGCPVSLISSMAFVRQQSTDALWHYLERNPNCQLSGAPSVGGENTVVAIVDNSLHEIQRVLKGSHETTYEDWLDEYRQRPANSGQVILPNSSVWFKPDQNLRSLKLSLRRKAQKLSEDPKRFFSDSNIPVFRYLGKLIPMREAA